MIFYKIEQEIQKEYKLYFKLQIKEAEDLDN